MKKENNVISIFNTSISCYNTGNQIIMDAVNSELYNMFNGSFFVNLPVQDIKRNARRYNEISDISFIGGTNILNSDILNYSQFDFSLHNILRLRNIVLMGCGWFQYEQSKITIYTSWAFRKILSSKYTHSVRDSYTEEKLKAIGIKSINTGCPTIWNLQNESINRTKSDSVVVTLTDYNKNPKRDSHILNVCLNNYKHRYYFPQGIGDYDYLSDLGFIDKFHILSPHLSCYNNILLAGNIDYVGTRLHAGIRALQKNIRSFIIGIDNRACEMAKDFNLPVVKESDLNILSDLLNSDYNTKINVPYNNINQWKRQFQVK